MLLAFAGSRSAHARSTSQSGSLIGAFGGLYLEATLARIDRWHAEAIAAVAAAEAGERRMDTVLDQLRTEGALD